VGTAHAKAILFGEHAVVYGSPAVAVPLHALTARAEVTPRLGGTHIDSELFVGEADEAPARIQPLLAALHSAQARTAQARRTLDLRLTSSIPYERGLGSSAAVAVAVARAVADLAGVPLTADEVFSVSMDAERIAHGSSSGLDGRTVCSPTPIRFHAGRVDPVAVSAPFTLVLADTGRAGSTSRSVGAVRSELSSDPSRFTPMIDRLGELAESSLTPLATGDRRALGAQMSEAHRTLAALGVSDPGLDRLVAAADAAGALGAKLTGGGRGGCILALANDEDHARLLENDLRHAGAVRTWCTSVGTA
jgi:mevalonate kinase